MANQLKMTSSQASSSTKGQTVTNLNNKSDLQIGVGAIMRFLVTPTGLGGSTDTKGHMNITLKNAAGARIDSYSGALPTVLGQFRGLILGPVASGGDLKRVLGEEPSDSNLLIYDLETTGAAGPDYTVEVMISGKIINLSMFVDNTSAGQETQGIGFNSYNEDFNGSGVYEATFPLEFTN